MNNGMSFGLSWMSSF